MKLFNWVSRRKASANATEEETPQQQEQPTVSSYTTLFEALDGETVDDVQAREIVFYKPGGNVIIATDGKILKLAFRISKHDFTERFRWSDGLDADTSTIPKELSGFDILDLYSSLAKEESTEKPKEEDTPTINTATTRNTLRKVFQAYSIKLLQQLHEEYDSVRRVKTTIQASGEPTETIRSLDILDIPIAEIASYLPDTRSISTEHLLTIDQIDRSMITLTNIDPGFTPRTAEESVLHFHAQRETTLEEVYQLVIAQDFVWSDMIAAFKTLFLEHVITFDYPGKTVDDATIRENLLPPPEPEPEPEPEVVEAAETTDSDDVSTDIGEEVSLPDFSLEDISTPVDEETSLPSKEVSSTPAPEQEAAPEPAPAVFTKTGIILDLSPTVEKPADSVQEEGTVTEPVKIDEDEVLEPGQDSDHAAADESPSHDDTSVEEATSETSEDTADDDPYDDYTFPEPSYPADSLIFDEIMRSKGRDRDTTEDQEQAPVLPDIDFAEVSTNTSDGEYVPNDLEEALSFIDRFRSQGHEPIKNAPQQPATDKQNIEERQSSEEVSAFDLNHAMIQGKRSARPENSPLFEKLAKERGINIPDN